MLLNIAMCVFMVVLLAASTYSLSSLEMVVKEMGVLEDRIVGHRSRRETSVNARHVMDLMLGFEEKRMLKDSQAYIKEFLKLEKLSPLSKDEHPQLGHRRVKRTMAVDNSNLYKNYAVTGVSDTAFYSPSVAEADLQGMSGLHELQSTSGFAFMCWVKGMYAECLFGDVSSSGELPTTSLPTMDIAVKSNKALLSSNKQTLYVFQTLYEDSTSPDISCLYVVYEVTSNYDTTSQSDVTATYKTHVMNTIPNAVVTTLPRSSEILVIDGIFFATFNTDALTTDGLHLYYYSITGNILALVMSSNSPDSVFTKHQVTTGIKDVVLFSINSVNYLAIARDYSCILYEFDNSATSSILTLKQKFKLSAISVNFFANSYGTFLVFIDSSGLGSSYLLVSGEFIQMQDQQDWGTGELTSQGLQTSGSFLLPEQELVFIGDQMKFLKFDSPGILVKSTALSMVRPDGESITGLALGRKSMEAVSTTTDVSDFVYFIVTKVVAADGTMTMEFNDLTATQDGGVSYTNLGDLANSVLLLETNVIEDHQTVATLSGELDLIKVTDAKTNSQLVLTAETITISGTTSVNSIEVTVEHETSIKPTFATIDYNEVTSDIATALLQSTIVPTNPNYLYKNSILKSGSSPISMVTGGKITAPSVTTFKAYVAKLDTTTVKGHSSSVEQSMQTFLRSLRTAGPQTLSNFFIFNNVIVTDTTEFKIDSVTSAVEPHKYIDISKSNVLSGPITFTNIHFKTAPVFETTINNVALQDIITIADATTATIADPIQIYGSKTFSGGLTVDSSINIGTINGIAPDKMLNGQLLFKEDPSVSDFVQTVSCTSFFFNNIKVRTGLLMPTFGSGQYDVRSSILEDIVVTHTDNGDIGGSNTFSKAVAINNLKPLTINTKDPAELLISGEVQDIQSKVTATKLVTGYLAVTNLNNVDLDSDVARTDIENTFSASITFNADMAVTTSVGIADSKTIAGVDVSELQQTAQNYDGVVTVTGSLVIDNSISVTNMEFSVATETGNGGAGFTSVPVDKSTFDSYFFYKDTAQVIPNLGTVDEATALNFDVLTLETTLDGLDLTVDVVHTYGEETIDFDGIAFNAETTLKDDIQIVDESGVFADRPTIGGVDVTTLHEQIFCPLDGVTRFEGIKTLSADTTDAAEVISYFDVTATEFVVNTRNFKGFVGGTDVADIIGPNGNTFGGKMTFAHEVHVSGDFTVNTGYDITAMDLDTVILNGMNIKEFDNKIVKVTEESYDVTTPVEFQHITVNTGILATGGTIDDVDPVEYLNERVLLDDAEDLTVKLTSPTINFEEGVTMEADVDNVDTYFADQNLVTYKDSLYVRSSAEVSGQKTFSEAMSLTVNGDVSFGADLHPFGVDIPMLYSTGLTKSTDQIINLEYTINSISKVEKITSDKIDETIVSDICLIDADCSITCPEESPCITFNPTITSNDGISIDGHLEGIDVSTVLASLAGNDNTYNLDTLEVPNGDFSWTTDVDPVNIVVEMIDTSTTNTVSDLYSSLMVKSDKDWSVTTAEATVVQDVSATVVFKETMVFDDMTLDSGVINEGSEDLEVNPEAIILDSATKDGINLFVEIKKFQAQVVANTATVEKLLSVDEINDLNIEDYRTKVLVTDDEEFPGNDNFEQEVTGAWSMANGVKVTGRLSVSGEVDEVEVEDLVRKDVVSLKAIPAVTFNEGAIVSGDIVTTGTDFQTSITNFFTNAIKVNDVSTINQNLKFSGEVSIDSTVSITKLNDMPANTWVETDVDEEEQVISTMKTFSQETVSVKGNLVSDDIADVDLSTKYADALKIDEDAEITGPKVKFNAKTTLTLENLDAPIDPVFNTLMDKFVSQIGIFINSLYDYYTSNIVDVLPTFLREVEVAKQLDLGKLSFLEELKVPSYLTMEYNADMKAVAVTAVKMDRSLYSINFMANSTACGLSAPCSCQSSRLASSLDQSGSATSEDKTFSFSLSLGLFTVSSKVDSYSDQCNIAEENSGLVVSGILTDSFTASANLALLSPAMVGLNLIPKDLVDVSPVGYVMDVEMWELGQVVYLAVASTYKFDDVFQKPKVQLYKLDTAADTVGWVDAGKIEAEDGVDIGPVITLKVVKFTDNEDGSVIEKVHLLAGRMVTISFWGQPMNDIWVYEMSMTSGIQSPSNGISFKQKIAAPGLVGMELLLYKEKAFTESEVLLVVATNIKLSFGPDTATVSVYVFDTANKLYKMALLPDNVQVVGNNIVKMVSHNVARHTVLFLAEYNRLSIYRYVPYQGLRLVDSLDMENILDFTVYSEWGNKGEQVMVYMLLKGPKSMLFTLKVSGTVPTVELSFPHYQT